MFYGMQVQHAHLVQLIAGRHRMNPVDVRAVKMLGIHDQPPTVKMVGQYLQMGTGAMTALLDRLEGRAFVERVPNPSDRRSVLIRLLPAGREVVAELRDAYQRGLTAAIDASSRGTFSTMVDRVGDEFRRIAAGG